MATLEFTPAVLIDFVAIIVGLVSFGLIYGVREHVKKPMKQIFLMQLLGIAFQVLAIAYTLTFARFKLYPIPGGIDIHHLLMLFGLVMFVWSFRKIYEQRKIFNI
ncbi:MAG: hypothetical protein HY366_00355 [Candidatus Aenigmarchaeota archaeon]|nr:hypothetical protein [Candidatus Aenigmarchaeota archaeon]